MINLSYYRTKALITAILALGALASAALSLLWDFWLLHGVSPIAASSVIGLLLFAYNQWLWKYPVLNLLVTVPDISGTYRGRVNYHREGKPGHKECELTIKQTASHIKVTTIFDTGKENDPATRSTSTVTQLTRDASGDHKLFFYYQNTGSQLAGNTLTQHDGTCVLDIQQSGSNTILDGYYFTNREPQTKGIMRVEKVAPQQEIPHA